MRKRLRDILVAAGFDPSLRYQRVRSGVNEVWIGDAIVVRIGAAGTERLAREVAIAQGLPPEVRYPEILAHGLDWIIAKRVAGAELGRAWADMTRGDRERAVGQLATILDALHAVQPSGIPDDIAGPHAVTRAAALDTAERAALAIGNDTVLIYEVANFIRDRWDRAFEGARDVQIHGDPHFENVLWDGSNITALLDLEWSRRAPRECDLEILLAVADHPALFAAEDYAPAIDAMAYRPISKWLATARPAWFADPALPDRIALLFASRTLGHLVDAPGSSVHIAHLRALVGR